jgi:hypothetical protein
MYPNRLICGGVSVDHFNASYCLWVFCMLMSLCKSVRTETPCILKHQTQKVFKHFVSHQALSQVQLSRNLQQCAQVRRHRRPGRKCDIQRSSKPGVSEEDKGQTRFKRSGFNDSKQSLIKGLALSR